MGLLLWPNLHTKYFPISSHWAFCGLWPGSPALFSQGLLRLTQAPEVHFGNSSVAHTHHTLYCIQQQLTHFHIILTSKLATITEGTLCLVLLWKDIEFEYIIIIIIIL